jgi:ketosteroid isomerase-like protein
VHPGWCLLTGWEAVRHSWDVIFKNSHEMRFSIGDVHVHVEGGLGWVTCTENILSEARGTISVTSVLATNIFERSGSDWLMVHHHASHILTGDPSADA